MPSHVVNLQVTSGNKIYNVNSTVTNDQERSIDKTLAALTTNSEEDIVLTNAQVKSLVISCTGGDLTIKTNSSGSPDSTVVMTDGQVTYWSSVAGIGTNPFVEANVTKLYLTTTAGTVFSLRAIVSSTNG